MKIEARGLRKKYGFRTVVDNLDFELEEGKITGFLGPNGSGKSTTMALMLQLVHGDGQTLFDGKKYRALPKGSRRVGAYLGAKSFHPKYTAKRHLRISAFTRGIPLRRVAEVLEIVGLSSAQSTRVREMSTGMLQKLGVATAILSQPEVLILDEPANGLDPQSIQWLREFLKRFAHDGGTVLLSSHLINEVAQFADNILVIAQGKRIASEPIDTFLKRETPTGFRVRTQQSERFEALLLADHFLFERMSEDVLEVQTESSKELLSIASNNSIELIEIKPLGTSLEDIFLSVTSGLEQYRGVSEEEAGQAHPKDSVKTSASEDANDSTFEGIKHD